MHIGLQVFFLFLSNACARWKKFLWYILFGVIFIEIDIDETVIIIRTIIYIYILFFSLLLSKYYINIIIAIIIVLLLRSTLLPSPHYI